MSEISTGVRDKT